MPVLFSLDAITGPAIGDKHMTPQDAGLSAFTTQDSPAPPTVSRRLVWIPEAEQIDSPLMARYIKAREATRNTKGAIDTLNGALAYRTAQREPRKGKA